MQISLRSHLIAGTAAVVGASAIAMTPVMGAQLSLPAINVPTVAKVTLAGLDSPISELLGSVILGGQLLFNTTPTLVVDEFGDVVPNPEFNRAISRMTHWAATPRLVCSRRSSMMRCRSLASWASTARTTSTSPSRVCPPPASR